MNRNYVQSSDRQDVWMNERLPDREAKQLCWTHVKLRINPGRTKKPSRVHVYRDNFPSNVNLSQVQASWTSSGFEGSRRPR